MIANAPHWLLLDLIANLDQLLEGNCSATWTTSLGQLRARYVQLAEERAAADATAHPASGHSTVSPRAVSQGTLVAVRPRMKRERNEPTTVGDLDDLKADLSAKMDELKRDFTGSVNTMMEHVSSMMRAQGDAERTLQDKLDAHVADGTVHKRPARARRS